MSASARVPHVDEAVNFRDLALGINDWYNVTPSVRVAIEGLALVVQDQAARLERVRARAAIALPRRATRPRRSRIARAYERARRPHLPPRRLVFIAVPSR